MSFLLTLFSRTYSQTARQTVRKTFNLIKIHTEQALPDNYYELLFTSVEKHYTKKEILSQIIHYLPQATTEAAIVKIYTIIMCTIRLLNYDETICEALDQLQYVTLNKVNKSQRLVELQKSCKSYLLKLSSSSQLYRNSASNNSGSMEQEHVNLFRMMNQSNLLFPSFNTNINSIGRYYKQTYIYYKQFYRVWQSEVVHCYLAIKKSIDIILKYYQLINAQIVQCYLSSIPCIELLCDQMQNFMTNKYYKGKSPKIYFKQELLNEIQYYLVRCCNNNNNKKDEDFIKTAQDDFFYNNNK